MENDLNENFKKKSFLFLHGFTQNSEIFKKRIKVALKTLQSKFPNHQMIIPDAPHILNPEVLSNNNEEIQRGWLFLNSENKLDCTDFNLKSEVEYKGLLESLNTLKKIAIENKIEAIFSFSQGSLLTLLLILLIEFEDEYKFAFKNLKCIILCAAFLDPFPNNFEIRDKKEIIQSLLSKIDDTKNQGLINTPILNIFGETDEFIKKEKSKNIEKLFKNVESFIHPGKHFVPSSKEDIERYVIFLQKHIIED